jgi:hypothetical protein
LVVIMNGVAVDGVDVADEKAVGVEVGAAGNKVVGGERWWCGHGIMVNGVGRKGNWLD